MGSFVRYRFLAPYVGEPLSGSFVRFLGWCRIWSCRALGFVCADSELIRFETSRAGEARLGSFVQFFVFYLGRPQWLLGFVCAVTAFSN